jgi:HNH endonuclease
MSLSLALVSAMYADYQRGRSLAALARHYGHDRRSIREIFARRGLDLRRPPPMCSKDPKTGCFLPAKPHTPAQLEKIIATATWIHVPPELSLEWRRWPMDRRTWFIRRLRERFPSSRPTSPFSSNVEPFDYGSPRAREIVRRLNRGRDSRHRAAGLRPASEGVIYQGRLWYWVSSKHRFGDGYFLGIWRPGTGRPCLHHTIYEETHGPVPAGMTVIQKDGNKNNLDPSNLALRSRADCARQNQVWGRLRHDPLNPRLNQLADKIRAATIASRRRKSLSQTALLFNSQHQNQNANLKLIRHLV